MTVSTENQDIQSQTRMVQEHCLDAAGIRETIDRLADNLVNIKAGADGVGLFRDKGHVIDDKSWNVWNWPQGVGLYGLVSNYRITGNRKTLGIVTDWFDRAFAVGTPSKNVNSMAPILALAELYEITGREEYLPYLKAWGQWAMFDMARTEAGGMQHATVQDAHHNQLWADTLVMTVLPLAKIGMVLGREDYVREAKRQFLIHAQYLMDNATGLWFHGWTFDGRHNFSRAHWGRGNCWATIAIPEVISILGLEPGDPVRDWLSDVLRQQADALAALQDPETGLWHTLLDDPTTYLESSGSAGIAYGILKAVHERILGPECEAIGRRAVEGLVSRIDESGAVLDVSVGTAIGPDLDYYRTIERTPMPYGQSLSILALTELLVS